ncbi:MAG: hypothetical protein ACLPY5_02805 [Candidatus Bathyarchaeia archaeon]
MVDYFIFGVATGAAVLASITIAALNLRSSSRLEEQTGILVGRIENTLVDQELFRVIRELPYDMQSLSRAQRLELYVPMRVFSDLRIYEQKVSIIPDKAAQSIVMGILTGLLAITTGFLYENSNAFSTLSLAATFLLLTGYFFWGILPVVTIRALQRANRQLEQATTINDLRAILTRVLMDQFNVSSLPVERE